MAFKKIASAGGGEVKGRVMEVRAAAATSGTGAGDQTVRLAPVDVPEPRASGRSPAGETAADDAAAVEAAQDRAADDWAVDDKDETPARRRDWIIDEIDRLIGGGDGGYLVVEAAAGLGKTTLLRHLAATRGWPAHFAGVPYGTLPGLALRGLAAQIVRLRGLDDRLPAAVRPAWFAGLLAEAAAHEPLVLIVDDLDEVQAVGGMPLGLPRTLPQGVFVVGSRRDRSGDYGVRELRLSADDPRHLADVREWAATLAGEQPLATRLAAAGQDAAAFVATLLERSRGSWSYAGHLLADVRDGRLPAGELAAAPDDLWGYYRRSLAEARPEERSVLAALAAAREPLTLPELCDFAGAYPSPRLRTLLEDTWRPFVAAWEGVEPAYALRHRTLRDYLAKTRSPLGDEETVRLSEVGEAQAVRAMHARLADHYGRRWDAYGAAHLVTHLTAAGRAREVHRILALERDDTNLWYARQAELAEPSVFARTVQVARSLAESEADADLAAGKPAPALALEARYALIGASLERRAAGVPPALLRRLVGERVWTPVQALDYARRQTRPAPRAAALLAVAAEVPEPGPLTDEAYEVLAAVQHYRMTVLATLADLVPGGDPRWQGLIGRYLTVRGACADRAVVRALERLGHLVPERWFGPVLEHTVTPLTTGRAAALAAVLRHAPPDLLERAFDLIEELPSGGVTVLAAIAPRLSGDALPGVRRLLGRLDGTDLAAALDTLVPLLAPAFAPLAVDLARRLPSAAQRARALTAVAGRCATAPPPDEARTAGAAATGDEVTAVVPPVGEALRAAAEADDPGERVLLIAGLLHHAGPPERQRWLRTAREALDATEETGAWIRGLAALAGHGAQDAAWAQAMDRVAAVRDEADRADLLAVLVGHLPEPLLSRVFPLLDALGTDGSRAAVLIPLGRLLAGRAGQDGVLSRVAGLYDDVALRRVVHELAGHLPAGLLLEAARRIGDEQTRFAALADLAPRLAAGQLPALLDLLDEGTRQEDRAWLLAEIAPHLPAALLERAATGVVRDVVDQVRLFTAATARLTGDARQEAIAAAVTAAARIGAADDRVAAIAALLPCLPDGSARELGLAAAREELPPALRIMRRSEPLAQLLPHLDEDDRRAVVGETLTFAASRGEWPVFAYAVIPYLAGDPLEYALELAYRAGATPAGHALVAELAHRLPEPDRRDGVIAGVLDDVRGRPRAERADHLIALAPHLPGTLFDDVLDLTASLTEEDQARVLRGIAAHLPGRLSAAARRLALGLADASARVRTLTALLPGAPSGAERGRISGAALEAAYAGAADADALVRLIPYLTTATRKIMATDAITLARAARPRRRVDLLLTLAARLGDPALADEAFTRAGADGVRPGPDSLVEAAEAFGWTTVLNGLHDHVPVRFGDIVESLPADRLDAVAEALGSDRAFGTLAHELLPEGAGRAAVIRRLAAALPLLDKAGGPGTVAEVARAVQDVCRWWP